LNATQPIDGQRQRRYGQRTEVTDANVLGMVGVAWHMAQEDGLIGSSINVNGVSTLSAPASESADLSRMAEQTVSYRALGSMERARLVDSSHMY
jgi:hypothetical protein